jgi:hypothetical protein
MPINWEESSIYRKIFNKGFVVGITKAGFERLLQCEQFFVVKLASQLFGPPSTLHETQIQDMTDAERLARMFFAAPKCISWDELLSVS